ncbi:MAG: hypothetical protein ACYC48_00370 [Minisyncoccota bacterium]
MKEEYVMKTISVVAALEGTIIEELFDAMEKGLSGNNREPMAPGEKVIGEMNILEKAADFLCEKYGATEKKILGRLGNQEMQPLGPGEEMALSRELRTCRQKLRACASLLTESIVTRLAEHCEEGAFGVQIKSGDQIVLLAREDDLDSLFLAAMLAAAERGR